MHVEHTPQQSHSPNRDKYRNYNGVIALFVLFAILGFIFVVINHQEKPFADSSMQLLRGLPYAVFYSSAVVIIYALIVILAPITDTDGKRANIVCDSIYFLGFLLTLTALGVGFTEYAYQVIDNNQSAIDYFPVLLSYAGMALVTTVVGVFFRVIHRLIYPSVRIDENDNSPPPETNDLALNRGLLYPSVFGGYMAPLRCCCSCSPCSCEKRSESAAVEALSNDLNVLKNAVSQEKSAESKTITDQVASALKDLIQRAEDAKTRLDEMHRVSDGLGGKSFRKHKAPIDKVIEELQVFLDAIESPTTDVEGQKPGPA